MVTEVIGIDEAHIFELALLLSNILIWITNIIIMKVLLSDRKK